MNKNIRIFESPDELSLAMANELKRYLDQAKKNSGVFKIALSGGSTPENLYKKLAEEPFGNEIEWRHFQIFWGDERCVSPDHADSNYGMAYKILLSCISIPQSNIHRIHGEADPEKEAARYSGEIRRFVSSAKNNIPVFDWILLGLGSDGHTASLFPGDEHLWEKEDLYVVTIERQKSQKRISITLPVINNARRVTFIVTGAGKKEIVRQVLKERSKGRLLPSMMVCPQDGVIDWYLDGEASSLL